jgi:PPK2 family polyphosphate:nucleotide phosphotransferase
MAEAPDKDALKRQVAEDNARITTMQEPLYAEGDRALLIIFQAMDGAGKDSCIKHVLSGVNPQGCAVHSFKQPSREELAHDFLWRHTAALPGAGMLGVHNRSHYEEVLVVKVHPEYLKARPSNHITDPAKADAAFWETRYKTIMAWEADAAAKRIDVIKIFLHMSREEQKKRFLDRIKDPEKQWKFSVKDVEERAYWDRYMNAYEEALSATSTEKAPWYVVPADEQWESRAIVARIVREKLEEMAPHYPVLSKEQKAELVEGERMLRDE